MTTDVPSPHEIAYAWAPPEFDADIVMGAIHAEDTLLCAGRPGQTDQLVTSNVVERLATSFGILRKQQSEGRSRTPRSLAMWQNLEQLGAEVSPAFSELGSDALTLVELSTRYAGGASTDHFSQTRAFRALGRLWAGAFSAPGGMDLWIGNSAELIANPTSRFFRNTPPALPEGVELGSYFSYHANLLQHAISASRLPSSKLEIPIALGDWRGRRGRIRGTGVNSPVIEVHRRLESISGEGERLSIKLVDTHENKPIALVRMVRLRATSGHYDEYQALAAEVGGASLEAVTNTFHPDDLIGLWPRVRAMLDEAEHLIYELGIIEASYITPYWRQRGVGQILYRQLVSECDDLDLLLAIPRPFASAIPKESDLFHEALYCSAQLRLAHTFANMGGRYLLNGIMGIGKNQLIEMARVGLTERH